ncbi:MAG: L-serine ammonia-lyase, iron-sulfur-dependent, subunit alpha [Clostridia bacterium]|nr:L-serine ammonia-lyase, iron-sulfur-dependent, subunit alpha [Clostridia bacterium]
MLNSIATLVAEAGEGTISALAQRQEALQDEISVEDVRKKMAGHLEVMRASVEEGMQPSLHSLSGLSGGQAPRLEEAVKEGRTFGGELIGMASARALAIAECNACMGRIVAAPTAGSCGILPAALLTAQEVYGCDDDHLIDALFTAAVVGQVIADRATVSGAEGGCQAECGSAAAMAAAALVELRGGTPDMAAQACSFALMNSMGLVCDPVGGLVEVPCVYRNVSGVTNAITAADMALAGIRCPIPTDEVIDAMRDVGQYLPACLRETGEGGVAATETGQAIARKLAQM